MRATLKRRSIAAFLAAVFLSSSITPSFALRQTEPFEDKRRITGLEEALRSPDQALEKLTRLAHAVLPASRPSTTVQPAPADRGTGLEEPGGDEEGGSEKPSPTPALTEVTSLLTGTLEDFTTLLKQAPGLGGQAVWILRIRLNNPPFSHYAQPDEIQIRILQVLGQVRAVAQGEIDQLLSDVIKNRAQLYPENVVEMAKEIKAEREAPHAAEEELVKGSVDEVINWVRVQHGQAQAEALQAAIGRFEGEERAHLEKNGLRISRGIDSLRRMRQITDDRVTLDNHVFTISERSTLELVLWRVLIAAELDRILINQQPNPGLKEMLLALRTLARYRSMEPIQREQILRGVNQIERQVRDSSGKAYRPLARLLEDAGEEEIYVRLVAASEYVKNPLIFPPRLSEALQGMDQGDLVEQVKRMALHIGGILANMPEVQRINGLMESLMEAQTIDSLEKVVSQLQEGVGGGVVLSRAERFPATLENWILYLARHGAFFRIQRLSRGTREELIAALGDTLPLAAAFMQSGELARQYEEVLKTIREMEGQPEVDRHQLRDLEQQERILRVLYQLPLETIPDRVLEAEAYLKKKGIEPMVSSKVHLNGILKEYVRELGEVSTDTEVADIFRQVLALASLGGAFDSVTFGAEQVDFPRSAREWVMLLMMRGHLDIFLKNPDSVQRQLVRLHYVADPLAYAIMKSDLFDALTVRQDIPLENLDAFNVMISNVAQMPFQNRVPPLERLIRFMLIQLGDYLRDPGLIDPDGSVNKKLIVEVLDEMNQNRADYLSVLTSGPLKAGLNSLLDHDFPSFKGSSGPSAELGAGLEEGEILKVQNPSQELVWLSSGEGVKLLQGLLRLQEGKGVIDYGGRPGNSSRLPLPTASLQLEEGRISYRLESDHPFQAFPLTDQNFFLVEPAGKIAFFNVSEADRFDQIRFREIGSQARRRGRADEFLPELRKQDIPDPQVVWLEGELDKAEGQLAAAQRRLADLRALKDVSSSELDSAMEGEVRARGEVEKLQAELRAIRLERQAPAEAASPGPSAELGAGLEEETYSVDETLGYIRSTPGIEKLWTSQHPNGILIGNPNGDHLRPYLSEGSNGDGRHTRSLANGVLFISPASAAGLEEAQEQVLKKVLIVEKVRRGGQREELFWAKFLGHMAQRLYGSEVLLAESTEGAMEILQSKRPAAVVISEHFDGTPSQLLRRMEEEGRTLPAIVVGPPRDLEEEYAIHQLYQEGRVEWFWLEGSIPQGEEINFEFALAMLEAARRFALPDLDGFWPARAGRYLAAFESRAKENMEVLAFFEQAGIQPFLKDAQEAITSVDLKRFRTALGIVRQKFYDFHFRRAFYDPKLIMIPQEYWYELHSYLQAALRQISFSGFQPVPHEAWEEKIRQVQESVRQWFKTLTQGSETIQDPEWANAFKDAQLSLARDAAKWFKALSEQVEPSRQRDSIAIDLMSTLDPQVLPLIQDELSKGDQYPRELSDHFTQLLQQLTAGLEEIRFSATGEQMGVHGFLLQGEAVRLARLFAQAQAQGHSVPFAVVTTEAGLEQLTADLSLLAVDLIRNRTVLSDGIGDSVALQRAEELLKKFVADSALLVITRVSDLWGNIAEQIEGYLRLVGLRLEGAVDLEKAKALLTTVRSA